MPPELAPENLDETSWQRFVINYTYPVCFTRSLFAPDNTMLVNTLCLNENAKRHRISVFVDDGVNASCPSLVSDVKAYAQAWHQSIELVAAPIVTPSGERIKSDIRHVIRMQQALADQRIDRHSYVIGIGGGALLDAIGLVAATSHRGIRHIRVPTTVLAQNDSGVGVKNGVNLFQQKNYLGTFAPPFAVLNDYDFIEALPIRDRIAGMSEAVKVALIRDAVFYQWLEDHVGSLAEFNENAMRYMIKRCAQLHMHQIANGGDPFETGNARPLDFGHWAAHRLESLTAYRLRHGEAVAIGIALDTRYSVATGLLPAGSETRVCRLLEQLGFRLWHPALESRAGDGQLALIQGLTDFKEHLGGELTITLLESIGAGVEVHAIEHEQVCQAISWLKHHNGKHGYQAVHTHEH